MNRLLLISLFIAAFLNLNAQEEQESTFIPLNYKTLQKKASSSDAEIANPKKNIVAKTWVKRGELMRESFVIDLEQIGDGTSPFQLKLFYKEPLKSSKQEVNGVTYDVLEYERMHYYFLNDGMVMWKRIISVAENPLDEAYNSFVKAIELDKGDKLSKTIKDNLSKLKDNYKQLGLNDYYSGNKELSIKSFKRVNEINDLPLFNGVQDTIMLQYVGIISREIGDRKTAIEYYKKLNKLKKEPNTYLLIKEDYLQLADTVSAMETLKEAFSAFPDSVNVVANLIDLCIKTNNIDEGLDVINQAIEKNPANGFFYYWKGRLILKGNDENRVENALEVYNKAIEISPDLSYAYFDIGFIYYLVGQEFYNKGGQELDKRNRDILLNAGLENYNKAMPMFEKAIELNPTDKSILYESYDTLKRIYFKLQMTDKYNEVNEKLKNL